MNHRTTLHRFAKDFEEKMSHIIALGADMEEELQKDKEQTN